MKVTVEKLPQCQAHLTIEADPEELEKAKDEAFQKLAPRLAVPGFRPGKAPRDIAERYLGKDLLLDEAISNLMPDLLLRALEEHGLKPYIPPQVEIKQRRPLIFTASVELEPQITLGDYRSIRVSRKPVVVQENQVEETLQRLLENHATWVPVTEARPVRLGDMVVLDITGSAAGQTFYSVQNKTAVLSEDTPIVVPGLATAIAGATIGVERKITLDLPQDFHIAHLRGQPAEFTVTVREAKEKRFPPLDDAFAQSLGDYPDLAALKEHIRKKLQEKMEAQARTDLEEAVLKEVIERSQVEFPPTMLKREMEYILKLRMDEVRRLGLDWQTYLKIMGLNQEDYNKKYLEPIARQRIQRFSILSKIGEAESITIEQQELEAKMEEARKEEKAKPRDCRASSEEELASIVYLNLITQKALERLVAIATAGSPSEAGSEEKDGNQQL